MKILITESQYAYILESDMEYNNYKSLSGVNYDPQQNKGDIKNDGDFSHSLVKEVVWRAGALEINSLTGGKWFAENKEDVEKFALSVWNEKREGRPYYINLQNPFYYEYFWGGYLDDAESMGRVGLMNKLMREGYDGIIIGNDTWNDTADDNMVHSMQFVVFDLKNIKPA